MSVVPIRRVILIFLLGVGVTSFLSSLVYFYGLKSSSPRVAYPAAMQTCEMSDHGYLFYVTREQYWIFHTLLLGGGALAATAALLNYRWKVMRKLTADGWQLPR